MILRIAILTCFLLGAVPPTSAQPTGTGAQELFDQGRALVAAGKTAEGCDAFEQSLQLEPLATTLIALATCRERLGQLATARKLFRQAEQQTRSASDQMTAQLYQLARDKAAGLEPRVSKLTIRASEQSKNRGLQIQVGEKVIPAEMWNQALPINGGTYTITARAPGVNNWSMRVTIANASDFKTVEVPDLTAPERPRAPVQTGEPRSQLLALLLSFGGTVASWSLLFGAGSLADSDEKTAIVLGVAGGLGSLVAPSFGHWYAGKYFSRGMLMRLTGPLLVAGVIGGAQISDSDGLIALGVVSVLTGTAMFIYGTFDDIVTAPSRVRHWNRARGLAAAPIVTPRFAGFALAGRF